MSITITTPPDKLVASKNDAWTFVQTDDVNVSIQMNVFDEASGAQIASILAPIDANNRAMFNIKRLVASMGVVPNVLLYQLPSFAQTTTSLATNNLKKYHLQIVSVDRTNGQQISNVSTGVLYDLLAGKSFLNGNKNLLSLIGDGASSTRRFLTCQPQERNTFITTQQYLYYYHNHNGFAFALPAELKLNVKLYFNDKTTATAIFFDMFLND